MTDTRALHPRAWKPVQLELEGRLFFIHPDGTVYERIERKPETKAELDRVAKAREHKQPPPRWFRKSLRRIKDRGELVWIHDGFRRARDQQAERQARADQIIGRARGAPRPDEPEPAA